ncbi:MAG: hypothetical protein KDG50_15190 [Chromatiales bacterium]|nr:hypothetical protein [Chromatiales bacterium]
MRWFASIAARWSLPVLLAFSGLAAAGELPDLFGNSKASGLQECVEPTSDMRRNHMEYLLHQRDATVIHGVRTRKHSLANCIDCHVQGAPSGGYVAINRDDQFCGACHKSAGVSLDCFQCHATVPRKQQLADGHAVQSDLVLEPVLQEPLLASESVPVSETTEPKNLFNWGITNGAER